ncbi:MAG TPA: GWxTD domain-containing protein [Clostridiales bacterium]|nr:GWxTD domain-containing protein [Clostridiales bacterium]HQP69884.1 GWxTD domain-containing protein [Clostridiales bacterium]
MKKLIVLALLIMIISLAAKEFFYTDYACYKTDKTGVTRTEIYISIPIYYLEFDKNMSSTFSMKVFVYDKDNLVAEDKWKQKYSISKDEDKYSGAEIPVMSRMMLPPGYYRLVVEVDDLNSDKQIDVLEVPQDSKMFMVAGFEDKFSMSTIQLASRIITDKPDNKSEFFKQGVIILPNPSKIYGTSRPFLYYYNELYGLDKDDEIEYDWTISTAEGKEVKTGAVETKRSTGLSLVLADRISIPGLQTGAYNFTLKINNKKTGRTIEGKNNFFVYRKLDFVKDRIVEDENMPISSKDSLELDIMKDSDLLTEYDQVFLTLDKKEQDKYTNLLLTGKREFLKRYWAEKEKTQENSRKLFKQNIEKINADFSTSKIEGWKTDRGRIYLKMGAPSKKDIETYNNEYKDHEIWTYFTGNYTFVFADVHGFGEFKLVHSDYPGEKNDPNWQSKIKKSNF